MTGRFTTTTTPAQAAARREALRTCQRLELESTRLRDGLPPSGRPVGWSTFDVAPGGDEGEHADDQQGGHR